MFKKKGSKHKYRVTFESASGLPDGSFISVGWKRGAKDENHGETKQKMVFGGQAEWNESITLLCTLFKDHNGYDEKNVLVSLNEFNVKKKKSSSIAKTTLNLSDFADLRGSTQKKALSLKHKKEKGKSYTLNIAVSSELATGAEAEPTSETDVLSGDGEDEAKDEPDLDAYDDDDKKPPALAPVSSLPSAAAAPAPAPAAPVVAAAAPAAAAAPVLSRERSASIKEEKKEKERLEKEEKEREKKERKEREKREKEEKREEKKKKEEKKEDKEAAPAPAAPTAAAPASSAELEELKQTNADLVRERDELKGALELLSKKRKKDEKKLEVLEQSAESAEKERDALTVQLAEALKKQEEDSKKAEEERDALKKELREAKRKADDLSAELDAAKGSGSEKDGAVKRAQIERDAIAARSVEREAELEELRKKLAQASKDLEKSKSAREDSEERAEKLEADLAAAKKAQGGASAALVEEVESLRAKLKSKDEEIEELEAKVKAGKKGAASDSESDESDSDGEGKAKKGKGKELEKLAEEVERLEKELKEAGKRAEKAEDDLRAAKAAQKTQSATTRGADAEAQRLAGELKRAQEDAEEAQKRAEELEDAVSKLREEASEAGELQAEVRRLKDKIALLEERADRHPVKMHAEDGDGTDSKSEDDDDKSSKSSCEAETELQLLAELFDAGVAASPKDEGRSRMATVVVKHLTENNAFDDPSERVLAPVTSALELASKAHLAHLRTLTQWLVACWWLRREVGSRFSASPADDGGKEEVGIEEPRAPAEGAEPQAVFVHGIASMLFKTYAALLEKIYSSLDSMLVPAMVESRGAQQRSGAPGPATVVAVLADAAQALASARAPDAVRKQFFRQVCHFVSGMIVNVLLTQPEICTCGTGVQIKLGLSQLEEWLSRDPATTEARAQLEAAREAANLLVMDKAILLDSKVARETFPQLNAAQISHIVKYFRPDDYAKMPVDPAVVSAVSSQAKDNLPTTVDPRKLLD